MQRVQAKVAHYAKVTGGCDTTFEFTPHIAEQGFTRTAILLVCKLNMTAEMLQMEYGELGNFLLAWSQRIFQEYHSCKVI